MIPVGETIKVIRDPQNPDRTITIRNPGKPGTPEGNAGDVTICHDALCNPPEDPREPCQCDAFVFEIPSEPCSLLDWTITRKKGFAGCTFDEIVAGDPEHREYRAQRQREHEAWRRLKPDGLFSATDKQAELELTIEALTYIPEDRRRSVAKLFLTYGSYEPEYGTIGILAVNCGDPILKRIEAAGWPIDELERWLAHDEGRCSGCDICGTYEAWRRETLSAEELEYIERHIALDRDEVVRS